MMAVDQIARMMALDAAQSGGGGGGGTDNYNDLTNRPKINNVTLTGNKTTSDLGIVENVQANWNETDSTAPSYIQNKPNIPSGVVVDTTYNSASENAQAGTAVAQAVSTKVDKVTGKGLSENDYTNADKEKLDGIETGAEVNVQADWNQTDTTADDYIKNKPTIPTVNDATLTIQKNGTAVGTFSANSATAATINITVPVDAEDVGALPDTTKYGASLALSIDSSTYVVTATLKDQDGNTLGTAQTIDLPLETVVVGGSYDDTTKKVILTLKNGNTIDFSVADLVAGLQTEITSTNKLDADLVDDTTSVHKFVTAADKTAWNAKSDFSGDYDDLTNKPTIPAAQVNADWNAVSGVAQILNKPTIPTPVTVDQTYDDQSPNAQSGTAVAQALQDSGSEYSARVMDLEAAYGDPDYLEGLGYWGFVYHTKEYAESGSALSTLRNVTITPGTIILLKWDSADGRGYKDLTYMFSRIGMAVMAPDYPSSAGWSVRIVRYETDSQYTNPEPLPDDFDAVIYTSSITYGSSESYSHSIIKAPPMKPGKYYYYAIEFLNDNESASFTCSFNQKVIAYFLQEPSNQPIMYDGVTRQQFIMPKGIKSTDYATQNTGGTIKAWTTTDGSDTILHLATQ